MLSSDNAVWSETFNLLKKKKVISVMSAKMNYT